MKLYSKELKGSTVTFGVEYGDDDRDDSPTMVFQFAYNRSVIDHYVNENIVLEYRGASRIPYRPYRFEGNNMVCEDEDMAALIFMRFA